MRNEYSEYQCSFPLQFRLVWQLFLPRFPRGLSSFWMDFQFKIPSNIQLPWLLLLEAAEQRNHSEMILNSCKLRFSGLCSLKMEFSLLNPFLLRNDTLSCSYCLGERRNNENPTDLQKHQESYSLKVQSTLIVAVKPEVFQVKNNQIHLRMYRSIRAAHGNWRIVWSFIFKLGNIYSEKRRILDATELLLKPLAYIEREIAASWV